MTTGDKFELRRDDDDVSADTAEVLEEPSAADVVLEITGGLLADEEQLKEIRTGVVDEDSVEDVDAATLVV